VAYTEEDLRGFAFGLSILMYFYLCFCNFTKDSLKWVLAGFRAAFEVAYPAANILLPDNLYDLEKGLESIPFGLEKCVVCQDCDCVYSLKDGNENQIFFFFKKRKKSRN